MQFQVEVVQTLTQTVIFTIEAEREDEAADIILYRHLNDPRIISREDLSPEWAEEMITGVGLVESQEGGPC